MKSEKMLRYPSQLTRSTLGTSGTMTPFGAQNACILLLGISYGGPSNNKIIRCWFLSDIADESAQAIEILSSCKSHY